MFPILLSHVISCYHATHLDFFSSLFNTDSAKDCESIFLGVRVTIALLYDSASRVDLCHTLPCYVKQIISSLPCAYWNRNYLLFFEVIGKNLRII